MPPSPAPVPPRGQEELLYPNRDLIRDQEHLRFLAIGYYIFAGFATLGCAYGIFYMVMGSVVAGSMPRNAQGPDPKLFAWLFTGIGAMVSCFSVVLGVCFVLAGNNLRKRKKMVFCMVIAGFACMNVPLGTLLGVFTFIVLARPGVKAMFDGKIDEESMLPPPPQRLR